jgi:hypothetical protein
MPLGGGACRNEGRAEGGKRESLGVRGERSKELRNCRKEKERRGDEDEGNKMSLGHNKKCKGTSKSG